MKKPSPHLLGSARDLRYSPGCISVKSLHRSIFTSTTMVTFCPSKTRSGIPPPPFFGREFSQSMSSAPNYPLVNNVTKTSRTGLYDLHKAYRNLVASFSFSIDYDKIFSSLSIYCLPSMKEKV